MTSARSEIGISFLPESNHGRLLSVAKEVAKSPFDVISSYEDLGFPSPLLQLYTLAQHSESARMGPACLVVPKYASMETVLSQLVLLESLKPGNIFLGLAPGAWLNELAIKTAKVAQMQEAINSFLYLLTKQVSGFRGDFYTVEPGFSVNYETPRSIPVLVGAWGEKMLEMAGANKNVVEVKGGGSANSQMVGLMKKRLSPGLLQSQRSANEVGVVLGAVTVVDKDRQNALATAKRRAAMYIDVIGDKDPFAMEQYEKEIRQVQGLMSEGKHEEATNVISDELARLFVFAGTPDDIIEQSLSIYKAGAKRIEFGSPHGVETLPGINLLGQEVLPVLHKELSSLGLR